MKEQLAVLLVTATKKQLYEQIDRSSYGQYYKKREKDGELADDYKHFVDAILSFAADFAAAKH